MSEQAKVSESIMVSRVWIIPLTALIVGLWIIVNQWINQGTVITIQLPGAADIEENQTPIKVRDLEIGRVTKVVLKENVDGVIVSARIDKEAEHLLTETSKFWLVSPRISFSEVSGLNTLFSGSYIAMSGDGNGNQQTDFTALERPPVTPPGTPGLHITLTSFKDFAYKEGDPIVYKGYKVGEFEEAFFNQYERSMYYTAFVEAPYHRLLTQNTRFWDASGAKIRLRASGIEVDTGSVETLLSNGVTFDIPSGMPVGEAVEDSAYFEIYESEESAQDGRFRLSAEYLLLIDESVRGLNINAPVEYRGIRVGEVVSINKLPIESGTLLEQDYKIPVVINVYPGKARLGDTPDGLQQIRERMSTWIAQDLKATLRIGNLLSGALYIDLHHETGALDSDVNVIQGYEVIPTASTELTQITQKAEALLDKINSLPLETLSQNAIETIDQMSVAAESVKASSDNFDSLLSEVDMKTLNQQLIATLNNVTKLSERLAGSQLDREIKQAVNELQSTLKAMQPFLQQMSHAPNSLLFDKPSTDEMIPRAKEQ